MWGARCSGTNLSVPHSANPVSHSTCPMLCEERVPRDDLLSLVDLRGWARAATVGIRIDLCKSRMLARLLKLKLAHVGAIDSHHCFWPVGPTTKSGNFKHVAEPKSFGSADGWPAFGRPAGGGARCSHREMEMAADSTVRRFLTVSDQKGINKADSTGRQRANA